MVRLREMSSSEASLRHALISTSLRLKAADDELSVVVPSGYAPGAQVEVRVINAEGLQSAPLAFVYGLSEVTVFPSEAFSIPA